MILKTYKLLNLLASPILFSFMLFRLLRKKEDKKRFAERFGIASVKARPQGKIIWIHATSVGEIISIVPLMKSLTSNKKFHGTILLTSTTIGSLNLLQKITLPKKVIHQFYPIDNFFTVKKFINFWQPNLTIFVESEFWPYALSKAAKVSKIISLNTAISDSAFKKWFMVKFLTKEMFEKIDMFFPQSITDKKKLNKLGITNTKYIGHLKYSAPPLTYDAQELVTLKQNLKQRKILLFASTHEREEDLAIRIFNKLSKQQANLLFILIPRHPSRTNKICDLLEKHSLSFSLHSKSKKYIPNSTNFYIVDSIGETGLFFALSPITIMGGSFVNIGGHNIIEPAKLGSVIISGPYIHTFKDIIADFKQNNAIYMVNNADDCVTFIQNLWQDKKLFNSYKTNINTLLATKKNILKQVTDTLIEYIN